LREASFNDIALISSPDGVAPLLGRSLPIALMQGALASRHVVQLAKGFMCNASRDKAFVFRSIDPRVPSAGLPDRKPIDDAPVRDRREARSATADADRRFAGPN